MKPRGKPLTLAAVTLGLLTLAGAGLAMRSTIRCWYQTWTEEESTEVVQCRLNLREIHKLGMIYADTVGRDFYPHAPKGELASMQILVDYWKDMPMSILVCPAGTRRKDGRPRCDYELVPWKVATDDLPQSIVAFDREAHHCGKRVVVFLDGHVEVLDEEEFRETFDEQRVEFTTIETDLDDDEDGMVEPAAAEALKKIQGGEGR